MAENKQYIVQAEDNGAVMISEDVIATIVGQAVNEVEGVSGLSTKPGSDIADFIGKKNWGKGIKVIIADDNTITIECNVTVYYGQSVVTIAKSAQEAVTSAVEAMAGVKVSAVNMNVCGIVRK
jgi:uncharacterized alkaline shock family protein YloU